jgi:adenine deaminase
MTEEEAVAAGSDSSITSLKQVSDRQHLIDVLMDPGGHAGLVLTGGKVVNVISREVYEADVAIEGRHILMVGDCSELIGPGTRVVDLAGKYLSPGFIDSHMHFESAMLTITEFSRLSIPTGTTCLVSDPHEIGNVLGPKGIRAMCDEAALMPHHVHSRVPEITPDSPGLETAGYHITSRDIPEMLDYPTVSGIGETQGVTAARYVYQHNPGVFRDAVVSSTYARSVGKKVDGNADNLFGRDLAAHMIAGGTDISCHEQHTKAEAIEKLRYGVYVLMREGSTNRNMPELVKAITEEHLDSRRAILATDDMLAVDILKDGHMNDIIRRTIRQGVDAVTAIQMATINAATWQGLSDIGVLAPGKLADIAVIDGPLEEMNVSMVFLGGELVAQDGRLLIDLPPYTYPESVKHSVNRAPVEPDDLRVRCQAEGPVKVRCIGLILDSSSSDAIEAELPVAGDFVEPSLEKDLLPIAVVGRYGQPDIGSSFVHGFGMRYGAMAETVCHDAHNIMCMGTDYADMAVAVNRVIELQGGLVLVKDGRVIGELPMRVGGLITDELTAEELTATMARLTELAATELECKAHAPFMHLGFLSLTTSPKWRITDKGVVDAMNYCVLPTLID